MVIGPDGPGSPLSRPLDLSAAWNAGDDDLAARLHPVLAVGLAAAPEGDRVFRGLAFRLGRRASGRRWVAAGGGVSIPLPACGPTARLVIAHFADCWRDASGGRPPGMPVGWALPVGEPLATYAVELADGSVVTEEVRRRYEIDDGVIGWGSVPFAAVEHRPDEPLDWRGPHARQAAGRYASAGHAGPLTILPGSWAGSISGVTDHFPSHDDDLTLWLHSIALPPGAVPVALRVVPVGDGRPGSEVVIAGITAFDGDADPLAFAARRQLRVHGGGDALPEVDLGVAIRTIPAEPPGPGSGPAAGSADGGPALPVGWGCEGPGPGAPATGAPDADGPRIVDVALARDARLVVDGAGLAAADLAVGPVRLDGAHGPVTVELLPVPDVRVDVRLTADGRELPAARVRFVTRDGRYMAPLGHRDEVDPALCEDTGADVLLGGRAYACVPGSFSVDLPPGTVDVEVVHGFEHAPVRRSVDVGPGTRTLTFDLPRVVDLRPLGWVTADAHVHFLAPSTALLQAAAEDVGIVNLLATQWGDHVTSVTDLPWGTQADPSGRHLVVMGTENRQTVLGHVGLLGARRPVLPMASGGAPEGRIGQALTELIADWADRCRADDGVVVASHFPLPYAEVAADIVDGRMDAVEMQCFAPGLDNPSILEWYRFLSCGYRVPVVGGTDKMSAEVPIGAVRTYARMEPGAQLTFAGWAAAIRAGRTFATSGPVIDLEVDGHGPGDVIALPARGGTLGVHAHARAAQPIVGCLEIVVNGAVVASIEAPSPATGLDLDARVDLDAGAWIAARARSPFDLRSAFITNMAAHTSPVYVEVPDRPVASAEDARAIVAVIDGTARWIRGLAAARSDAERERMARQVEAAAARLRTRAGLPVS